MRASPRSHGASRAAAAVHHASLAILLTRPLIAPRKPPTCTSGEGEATPAGRPGIFADDGPLPGAILRRVLRKMRWTLIAFGVLALWRGGGSIFAMPENEVVYEARPPIVNCVTDRCFGIHILEVGNTGSEMQSLLRVRLKEEVVSVALLPVKARAYGKVDRPFAVNESDGVRTYRLPNVKPGERIELNFLFSAEEPQGLPKWDDMLLGIDASSGEVLPGGAAPITLGRWIYRLLAPW
jgi:hypothetical protein